MTPSDLLAGIEPAAWSWQGPRKGFLADDKKPAWPSEPLYTAASLAPLLQRLEKAESELADKQQAGIKVMPRGGVERNWWKEYQLLLRQFKKLAKAARQCVEEVDANLAKDDWPVKYRAPFAGLTQLREALPETYEEFKERTASPPAPQVQEDGWVLVPRKPTEHMLDCGACYEDPDGEYRNNPLYDEGDLARDVYRAMIDASPKLGDNNTEQAHGNG